MIHCLTPTGNRPQGLALLGEYINAQTYAGPLTWIVVDDCDPVSWIPAMRKGVTVLPVRPEWKWVPGMNSQAASMLLGLSHVPDDSNLFVLEDDDVYLPGYLQTMLDSLKKADLVGEGVSRYYNVATKRYRKLPSAAHASLAATGVKGQALQALKTACRASKSQIDIRLWKAYGGSKLLLTSTHVVGIKGLPGRPGIGVGHRAQFGTIDQGDKVLREWLGPLADSYLALERAA